MRHVLVIMFLTQKNRSSDEGERDWWIDFCVNEWMVYAFMLVFRFVQIASMSCFVEIDFCVNEFVHVFHFVEIDFCVNEWCTHLCTFSILSKLTFVSVSRVRNMLIFCRYWLLHRWMYAFMLIFYFVDIDFFDNELCTQYARFCFVDIDFCVNEFMQTCSFFV